tara:strand:- start:1282 stop:2994 length:1713 start_codon:yes stop_codon:yes gene_type:complete
MSLKNTSKMIFLLFLGFGARNPRLDCIVDPSGLYGDVNENDISKATIDFKENPPVLWPNSKFIYEIVTDDLQQGNPCYNRKKSYCGPQDHNACLGADENGLMDRTFKTTDGTYQAISQRLTTAGNEITAKAPSFSIERFNETIHSQLSVSPICVAYYKDGCFVTGIGYLGYASLMGIGWCFDDVPSIIHEILHALGLRHEHQSKISGEYLETCQDRKEACNPNDYNCYRNDDYLSYKNIHDFSSVMHYHIGGCSMDFTEKGERLLAEMNMTADDVGMVDTLSDTDAEALEFLYQGGSITWFPSPSPTFSPGGINCSEGMYKEPSQQRACYYPNAFSITSGNCELRAEGGCVTSKGHPNDDYPHNQDCKIEVLKSGYVDWIDFYLDVQSVLTVPPFQGTHDNNPWQTKIYLLKGHEIQFTAGDNWYPIKSDQRNNMWALCLNSSNAPNEIPTSKPTSSPSGAPTESAKEETSSPTVKTSTVPTSSPSGVPTESAKEETLSPTVKTSTVPTSSPSGAPTSESKPTRLKTEIIVIAVSSGVFFVGIVYFLVSKNSKTTKKAQVETITTTKLVF